VLEHASYVPRVRKLVYSTSKLSLHNKSLNLINNECNSRTNHTRVDLSMHGKNDFAEKSKTLLDTDLIIILLDHQNNFVEIKNN